MEGIEVTYEYCKKCVYTCGGRIMGQIVAIGIGGALGAILRHLVSSGVYSLFGRNFPYGTLSVNIGGSLIIGILFVLFANKNNVVPEYVVICVMVGLLGAFTTFSTFSLDTFKLLESSDIFKAFANVFLNVTLCLLATWCGIVLMRLFVEK